MAGEGVEWWIPPVFLPTVAAGAYIGVVLVIAPTLATVQMSGDLARLIADNRVLIVATVLVAGPALVEATRYLTLYEAGEYPFGQESDESPTAFHVDLHCANCGNAFTSDCEEGAVVDERSDGGVVRTEPDGEKTELTCPSCYVQERLEIVDRRPA